MTAQQVYQKFNEQYYLEGNNGGIQKHKHYILQMMNEFSKLMCDKQKEICAHNAKVYSVGKLEPTYGKVNPDTILNAPYPDELKNS